tara:strand:+ start:136187 stop:137146 length:960 start_codon:yes stop_codon:yes gene_type:complete
VKVAVIGARGFIGARLVQKLVEAGLETVPVGRTGPGQPPDMRVADALDSNALTHAIAKCDAAVHAIAGDPATITGAIAPLLEAARRTGVRRIVYLSSASVHGQSPAVGTDESSPLQTGQPIAYNNAKVEAERLLQATNAASTPEIVILRPGIVHGPGSRWLRMFARAMHDRSACLVNRGDNICNACHVDNLVEAVRLALTVPQAAGEAIFIGDDKVVRWRDLYEPIAAAMGRSLNDLPDAPEPFDDAIEERRVSRLLRRMFNRYSPRISAELALLQSCQVRLPQTKAKRLLGYVPPVSLAQSKRDAERWLRTERPWIRS